MDSPRRSTAERSQRPGPRPPAEGGGGCCPVPAERPEPGRAWGGTAPSPQESKLCACVRACVRCVEDREGYASWGR